MGKISSILDKKLNHLFWNLISNGAFLVILAILVVWTKDFLKIAVGMALILVAYIFFYGAYKVRSIKKSLDEIVKF